MNAAAGLRRAQYTVLPVLRVRAGEPRDKGGIDADDLVAFQK